MTALYSLGRWTLSSVLIWQFITSGCVYGEYCFFICATIALFRIDQGQSITIVNWWCYDAMCRALKTNNPIEKMLLIEIFNVEKTCTYCICFPFIYIFIKHTLSLCLVFHQFSHQHVVLLFVYVYIFFFACSHQFWNFSNWFIAWRQKHKCTLSGFFLVSKWVIYHLTDSSCAKRQRTESVCELCNIQLKNQIVHISNQ